MITNSFSTQRKGDDIFYRFLAVALALSPAILSFFPRVAAFFVPALAFPALLIFLIMHRRLPAFSKTGAGVTLAISALMFASVLWSIYPETSFEYSLKILPILIGSFILFTFAQNIDGQNAVRFAKIFPLAVIVAGVFPLINLCSNGFLHRLYTDMPFNTSLPNRSVIVFSLSALIALPLLLKNRTAHKKYLAMALFAVVLGILYITDSQAAQLAILIGIILFFFFPYTKKWAWASITAGLFILLFTAPFIAQWMFDALPVYATGNGWLQTGYATIRMEIWDFISRRALEQPLTGFGAEVTRRITDFDNPGIYYPKHDVLHPHNFILQLWIEFGALGAMLAVVFFGAILKALHDLPTSSSRLVLPVLGATIAVAAITYGLWQGWWVGLMGLLMVYGQLSTGQHHFLRSTK